MSSNTRCSEAPSAKKGASTAASPASIPRAVPSLGRSASVREGSPALQAQPRRPLPPRRSGLSRSLGDRPSKFSFVKPPQETRRTLEDILKEHVGFIRLNLKTIPCSRGDFVDVGELGAGAFGEVRRVRHSPSGKLLAVKQMRASSDTAEAERRLLQEIQCIRSANNRHIVSYYGLDVFEGDIYIYMELMLMSLDTMYNQVASLGTVIPERVLGKIAVSMLRGIIYLLLSLNVMHRDIKPSNVLLGEDGSIKLCDFGISKAMEKSTVRSAVGCEMYMAPERLNPETARNSYDVRSDVWSYGLTLLELAMLEFPYPCERTSSDIFRLIAVIVHGSVPEFPEGYSESFENFVEFCLQKNRTKRPKFTEPPETAPWPGAAHSLVQHPFVEEHSKNQTNVAEWFRQLMRASPSERAPLLEPGA
eukprot:m.152463 g.152463  ORF g.152463 m.152463 type:complete len:419 (-) comp10162_c1_seq3:89-1345(-)